MLWEKDGMGEAKGKERAKAKEEVKEERVHGMVVLCAADRISRMIVHKKAKVKANMAVDRAKVRAKDLGKDQRGVAGSAGGRTIHRNVVKEEEPRGE
jgi:hypothetical protein